MRFALLGDIHGNLEALTAVLDEIDRAGPDEVLCLGDIVGYGAEPAECLSAMRERDIVCIAGNHDLAACGMVDMAYFNAVARASVLWTTAALSDEQLAFLASRPLEYAHDHFALAHGTFDDPASFGYVLTLDDARLSLQCMNRRIGFIAHSHVPSVFVRDESGTVTVCEPSFSLPAGASALVNVGSVGQPRDRIPLACFVLYDSETGQIEMRRVKYDIASAGEKILAAGLPPLNAYRLFVGQ